MKYDADDYTDLRDGLSINRDDLEAEAIRQPNQFFHSSTGYAMAVSRRDKQKLDLELEISKLDRDIRDLAATEGEKISEAQIKQAIAREQGYQRAQKIYIDSCRAADKWQALQNAYRQRADMLKLLVQMRQTEYYGEVSGSAERRVSRERFDQGRRR